MVKHAANPIPLVVRLASPSRSNMWNQGGPLPWSAIGSRSPADVTGIARGPAGAARRGHQPSLAEGLEDRLLLSGSPTIYTVNSTGNGTTGTGTSGTLPYVVGQADANPNAYGSEIEFDPTVFKTAKTITLAGTLVLSKAAGPGGDRRPRREHRHGQRRRCRRSLLVVVGTTASPHRLDHLGWLCQRGRRH